jgi:DNA primase
LYLRSLGYDAIGLFGTGSYTQLDTLKRSGIRSYILCFDGDEAGRKGANRFKKHIGNDVFITDVLLPRGKDVNDLSAEELENLFQNS